jgi:hypothetical protein
MSIAQVILQQSLQLQSSAFDQREKKKPSVRIQIHRDNVPQLSRFSKIDRLD